MTKEEFVERWSEDIWERFVPRIQAMARTCGCEGCKLRARNANVLVDASLQDLQRVDPHRSTL